MNNPFQIMRAMQDPTKYFTELMSGNPAMQDPRARSAINMLQRHDTKGLQEMAENMCQEYGTTPQAVFDKVNSFRSF